jgi:hypothetical protein
VSDDPSAVKPDEAAEAEPVEPTTTEYLEFLGTDKVHGTEFYGETGTHAISNAHMKATHDVELGVKEAVWKRGPNRRFLVPTADLNPAAVEILAADPMFKLVTL